MAPFNPGEPVAEENPMPVSIIMGSGAYLPGEPVSDTNPCPVKIVEGSAGGVTTGAFVKASRFGPVFTAPTDTTLNILAGTQVEVGGSLQSFESDTAVVMPTLTAGTNYAIYVCTDGTVRADADFTTPSGYTSDEVRKIGGFHFAPGGNATAQSGGNSTAAINPYSIWDERWRPACPDPRGMTLVANRFWVDIYLLNTNHPTNGTSAYAAGIADNSSQFPKVSTTFGGNGSTSYTNLNWYTASEIMNGVGKQLLSYDEFSAAAYGVTEGSAGGGASTALDAPRTSKWGVMQATGCKWVWSRDVIYMLGGADYTAATTGSYKNQTGGRGQVFTFGTTGVGAVILGGDNSAGSNAGSRSAQVVHALWATGVIVGARGRSDHIAF